MRVRITEIVTAIVIVLCATFSTAQDLTVRDFVGSHQNSSFRDGTKVDGRFWSPGGIVGNSDVYVVDTGNNVIRKITGAINGAGVTSTLAGLEHAFGLTDGTRDAARFSAPTALAMGSDGNIYVADRYNHAIRKVTPQGVVTTIAGGNGSGLVNGPAATSRFYEPVGLVFDTSGNLFIVDSGNRVIRKLATDGTVSTFAGGAPDGICQSFDGTGSAASFCSPFGITIDDSGNLYVADQGSSVIRKITPSAAVTTAIGSKNNPGGGTNGIRFPQGVAWGGNGQLYVADTGNHEIRMFLSPGITYDSRVAGLPGTSGALDGSGAAARFNNPTSLFYSGGYLFVVDTGNHALRQVVNGNVTTFGGLLTTCCTDLDGNGTSARFSRPTGSAVDSQGNLFVADRTSHIIRRVTPAGDVTTFAGAAGVAGTADASGSAARFNQPGDITIDAQDNLYVSDTGNNSIRRITPAGAVSTFAGLTGSGTFGSVDGTGTAARFSFPRGIGIDGAGNLYVADSANRTIRKISPSAVVTTIAGAVGQSGQVDGVGSAARFYYPWALESDASGVLYAGDGSSVRRIAPDGTVTTLAGNSTQSGHVDGVGANARFTQIFALTLDGGGNVIAPENGRYVRKIAPDGTVTTVAGRGVDGGSDGTGSGADIGTIEGVSRGADGTLYFSDNCRIRKGTVAIPDRAAIDSASGMIGAARQLSVANLTASSFSWSLIRRPGDSSVDVSSPATANPTFTPDVDGIYRFELTATSAMGSSVSTVDLVATCASFNGPTIAQVTGTNPSCPSSTVGLLASAGYTYYIWSNGKFGRRIDVNPATTATFSVVGYEGSCPSNPTSYTQNVATTLTAVTLNVTGSTAACVNIPGPTFSPNLTGGGTFSADWYYRTTPGGAMSFLCGGCSTYQVNSYLQFSAGTYYMVAKVTPQCGPQMYSNDVQFTVSSKPPVPVITAGGLTTFCAGGSVTLTAPAGYSYLWSTGETTQAITVGATGSYSVTVANASGCTATSAAKSVTVNASPPAPTVTASGATTFCAGGSVVLTAPGGYTYTWSNGATTQAITVNASGSYSVTVRDANSCSAASAPTVVTVNALPAATITAGGPTTFCAGDSVTLTASSGASYLWSTGLTTPSITVSTSGNYSVTVTDANGCSATSAPKSVTVNANPTATIAAGGPTTFCAGSSVTLTASGGSSYLWSTGDTTPSIAVNTGGTYSVVATNGNGCSAASAPVLVTVNDVPQTPAVTATGPTTFCAGGSVTLIAPDGYLYAWSNGATTQSIVVNTSGDYSVTVTGASGCGATSAPTNVAVNANPAATVTASGSTTFCAGGSVTLTASSGVSYLWSTGATDPSITVSDSGSYSVTVTDANGCSATSTPTMVTANANPPANITAGGPTTFCAGGSVTLTASSGASYLWSNGATTQSIAVSTGGTYSVTVTDGNACSATSAPTTVTVNPNPVASITAGGPTTFCAGGSVTLTASSGASYLWANGATTQSIAVNASGTYSVTVTNAFGCSTVSAATTVTANPLPATPSITAGGPTTFCAGGSVTLTAPAGYTYAWSNGATTQSITSSASGSYSVTVTDTNGCSAMSAPAVVTVNPLPPTPVVTAGGPTTFCAGGNVTLTAPSGYSYSWNNGANTQAITVNTSGAYSVTVTDANGCSATSAATVVAVNANPTASITAGGPTTFCAGGSVTLTASSGASYLWSTGATTLSISTNTGGSYSVTVTDANGCSATSAATVVTVNANPTASITAGGPTTFCAGGSVTLTASSGASYLWSTGATTPSISATASGSYSVRVTDTNGCSATSASTVVTVNANPTASITAGGPTTFCAGGSVTLTASSGSSYLWSNGATTSSIVVNASGSYSVTVTNGSNCSAMSTQTVVTVNSNPATPAVAAGGPTTFCPGGSVTLTAPAGYTYLWSNGATTQAITTSAAGNYSVTVTNANGCSATSAATVVTLKTAPATPTITAGGPTTFCAGGSVMLTAPAGFTYLWSTGATTQAITASVSGSFSVTVTNANACSAMSAPTVVTVNSVTATITAGGPTTFCSGGSVTLTASSGASYLWSNGATTSSITVSTAGSYTVRVTSAAGCSATSAATVVTVNAKPATPTITAGGPTTFCSGGSVTLTAPAGFTYTWSTGATTQAITVSTAGSYTVTVHNANGCTATSAATVVTVNPTPSITSFSPTTQSVNKNQTPTAITVVASGTGTKTYQWYKGTSGTTTNPIAGATSTSYSPPTNSRGTFTYWVRVTIGTCTANSATSTLTVN